MRKLLLVLIAAITIAVPIAMAAPAQAAPGSPRCMTKGEWNNIHDGMTRARVKQITGNWGKVTDRAYYGDGTRWVNVEFRQCKRNGKPARSWNNVGISFSTEILYGKNVWNPYLDYDCNDYDCWDIGGWEWDEYAERGVTRYPRVDYKGGWYSVS